MRRRGLDPFFRVNSTPKGLLTEAAEEAGIDQLDLRFPLKTTVKMERGQVHMKQKREDWHVLYPQDKRQVKQLLREVNRYCKLSCIAIRVEPH